MSLATRLRIPRHWEDASPEWMTAALARDHPGARVGTVTLVTSDDGTNRRARYALTYAEGSGPDRVFLKAHAPGHRWVHFRNGNLWGEARLFASNTELPVDHPKVYASVVDLLRLDFLLVMEDLLDRAADPRDATRPMTVGQVADGLRGLAKLHSRYWNFSARTHPRLRFVQTWKASKGWTVGLAKRIPIGLERAGMDLAADAVLGWWSRYVDTLAQGPVTLLHGDAHIGNSYVLPGDRVGFLDWQVVRRGEWSQDAGYFLVSALTEEDRRTHERALLEEYRQARELPDRPTADHVWNRYRSSQAYGLAIWLSTLGTDGWQRREVSETLARRFATAFEELETRALLPA